MKNKITDEKVGEFIKQCADEVKREMDYELRVAESNFYMAENALIHTFSEEQKQLYKEYLDKRQRYFDLFFQQVKDKNI